MFLPNLLVKAFTTSSHCSEGTSRWLHESGRKHAVAAFVDYYNHWRYHEGVDNVTPADVYYDRRGVILERRKEVKARTLQRPPPLQACLLQVLSHYGQ